MLGAPLFPAPSIACAPPSPRTPWPRAEGRAARSRREGESASRGTGAPGLRRSKPLEACGLHELPFPLQYHQGGVGGRERKLDVLEVTSEVGRSVAQDAIEERLAMGLRPAGERPR